MAIDRRNFFKLAAAGTASLALGGSLSAEDTPPDQSDPYGVLVDTVTCIGCRKCEWACNDVNHLPTKELKAFEDRSVFKEHRRPDADAFTVVNQFADSGNPDKKFTMKVQCMHCLFPACASACIVGALRKSPDGPVSYDAWKCIGCRYCMVACPFQIPAYEYHNALDPQVKKCTFCATRLQEGRKPGCVGICPEEALTFGKRSELIDVARTRIAAKPDKYIDHIYGEHEIGGTSWLYLAGVNFANTELPALDDEQIPHKTEQIQHGIFKNFVPPLALYGLLGLVMHSLRENKEKETEHENA